MCLCLIKPIVTFVFYLQLFILCTILYFVNLSVLVFLCSVCQTWFKKYLVIMSQRAEEPFRHQLRGGASVHLYDCIPPPLWPSKVHFFNLPDKDTIWSLLILLLIVHMYHHYFHISYFHTYFIILLFCSWQCSVYTWFWIFWLIFPFKKMTELWNAAPSGGEFDLTQGETSEWFWKDLRWKLCYVPVIPSCQSSDSCSASCDVLSWKTGNTDEYIQL